MKEMAIDLAIHPDKLSGLKQKILAQKESSNLFKPKNFTLDFESKIDKSNGLIFKKFLYFIYH